VATWLTTKEAMAYLKLKSRTTFYRLVGEGRIRAYVISGTDEKRYKQDELDELLIPVSSEQAQDDN
jgi:excisionase family DNA binding protein